MKKRPSFDSFTMTEAGLIVGLDSNGDIWISSGGTRWVPIKFDSRYGYENLEWTEKG